MELKVWVEGIQRIVCGVTQATTCQDVVYALAHATGKTGRFTLIERWRSNERLLAPNQHPLKVLLKWGEHASDVQFILQRTSLECQTSGGNATTKNVNTPLTSQSPAVSVSSSSQQKSPGINSGSHQQYNGPYTQQHQNISESPTQQHQQQLSNTRLSPTAATGGGAGRSHQRPLSPGSTGHHRDIKKSLTFSGGALVGGDDGNNVNRRMVHQVSLESANQFVSSPSSYSCDSGTNPVHSRQSSVDTIMSSSNNNKMVQHIQQPPQQMMHYQPQQQYHPNNASTSETTGYQMQQQFSNANSVQHSYQNNAYSGATSQQMMQQPVYGHSYANSVDMTRVAQYPSPPQSGGKMMTRPAAPPPYEIARGNPPPPILTNGGSIRGIRHTMPPNRGPECNNSSYDNNWNYRGTSPVYYNNSNTHQVGDPSNSFIDNKVHVSTNSTQSPVYAHSHISSTSSPLPFSHPQSAFSEVSSSAGDKRAAAGNAQRGGGGPSPRALPPYRPPPPPPVSAVLSGMNSTNRHRDSSRSPSKKFSDSINKYSSNDTDNGCSNSEIPRLKSSPDESNNYKFNGKKANESVVVGTKKSNQFSRNASVSHIPMYSNNNHILNNSKSDSQILSQPNMRFSPTKFSVTDHPNSKSDATTFHMAQSDTVANPSSCSSVVNLQKFTHSDNNVDGRESLGSSSTEHTSVPIHQRPLSPRQSAPTVPNSPGSSSAMKTTDSLHYDNSSIPGQPGQLKHIGKSSVQSTVVPSNNSTSSGHHNPPYSNNQMALQSYPTAQMNHSPIQQPIYEQRPNVPSSAPPSSVASDIYHSTESEAHIYGSNSIGGDNRAANTTASEITYDRAAAINGYEQQKHDQLKQYSQGWLSNSDPNLLETNEPKENVGGIKAPNPQTDANAALGRQVEHVVLDGIHRDLVNLVNLQRDKLTAQQVQLTKFEAEITYLEGRWREDQAKLNYANAEMERLTERMKNLDNEVSEAEQQKCEAELSAALASESKLKDQLRALQGKMQECDGKVKQLRYEIQALEAEMTALQEITPPLPSEVQNDDATAADNNAEDSQELAKQLEEVESALIGKREQVEELKRAMMTENLEALSLTPPDRRLQQNGNGGTSPNSSGAGVKTGSSRRMVGSPRMLETAVPTSKNPHGVWV